MTPDANPSHDHTPEEERRIREAALDETLAGSFPASDPLSTNPNPYDDSTDRADADNVEAVGRRIDRSGTPPP